jgi:hypothetical protein
MNNKIVVTPQVFLDLFCICLLWYEDKAHEKHKFYTVDGVARILERMGIISNIQRKSLYKDSRVQRLFMNSLVILPAYCHYKDYTDHRDRVKVLNEKALLELRQDHTKNINSQRLLRDYKLNLTDKGKRFATDIIEKYSSVLFEGDFLEAVEKLNVKRDKGAMASIMENYKKKVDKETDEK